jgi:hypothetical protein
MLSNPVIIAAIVTGAATVIAAIIALIKRKPEPANSRNVSTGNISAGGPVVVGEHGTITITEYEESRLISRDGAKFILEASRKIIPDEEARFEWSAFDVRFLLQCFKDSPRGWIFDGSAARPFLKTENDGVFYLGGCVYTEACDIATPSDKDYRILAIINEAYVTARFLLRSASIVHHPTYSTQVDDFQRVWDGTERGWCLVAGGLDGAGQDMMIFNQNLRTALLIDTLDTHRAVVEKLLESGAPVLHPSDVGLVLPMS